MSRETHDDLGPCCVCGKSGPMVRNIIMIDKKCPTPGKGWGCLQCGLSSDGAVAVKCDDCLNSKAKWACKGYPGKDGRVPIEQLEGVHEHDMSKHPEAQRRTTLRCCKLCGCTDERGCEGGCYWVLPDVCSRCAIEQLVHAGIDPGPLLAGAEWMIYSSGGEDLPVDLTFDEVPALQQPPLWRPGDPL